MNTPPDASSATPAAPHRQPAQEVPAGPWTRASKRLAHLAVSWYLCAAASTTFITLYLGFDDWYLFALMCLTTSIMVANYVRLQGARSALRRGRSLLFTTVVVLAWSALLYERISLGWTVRAGVAEDLGQQPLFWIPVACGLLTVATLWVHFFVFTPRAQAEQRAHA